MNAKLYMRAEGEEVALTALQEALEGRVHGQIRARKYVGTPPENYRPFYWASGEISLARDGAGDVGVQHMLKEILKARSVLTGLNFCLVVVLINDEIEGLSGFYLNQEIIRLVTLVGAGLDVDIVGSPADKVRG